MEKSSRRAAGAGLVLALAAGCVSLKSVSATAQLGEDLRARVPTLQALDDGCRMRMAAGLQSRCPAQTARWRKALEMVADYAVELGALAESDAPDVEADLEGSIAAGRRAGWLTLGRDADPIVAKTAQLISAFVAGGYTRARIGEVVRDVQPHLARVLALLDQHLATEREQLMILQCHVACSAGTPLPPASCPDTPASICDKPADPAVAFAMVGLSASLRDQALTIAETRRSITAFGRAHQRLYESAARLDDRAVYERILADLKEIYATAEPAL